MDGPFFSRRKADSCAETPAAIVTIESTQAHEFRVTIGITADKLQRDRQVAVIEPAYG
jgi:hypothetical protein